MNRCLVEFGYEDAIMTCHRVEGHDGDHSGPLTGSFAGGILAQLKEVLASQVIEAPRAGEMHPVDRAFYDLAIKERDYERHRVDHLNEQLVQTRRLIDQVDLAYQTEIEQALEALCNTQCPAFRSEGTCQSGCHQEPSCQVDQPTEGWEKAAIDILERLLPDRNQQGEQTSGNE